MKKYIILSIVVITLAIGAGCVLSSGTLVLSYEVEGFQPVPGNMQKTYIDLTTEKDYDKHKDKLESIDAVSVVGDIANLGFSPITSEFWISDGSYDNPTDVRSHGTRVFVSPSIAAGDTLHMNYANGLDYIENLNVLKSKIKDSGQFYVYGIPSVSTVVWYHVALVITLTAGL